MSTLRPGISVVIPHYGDPAPTLALLAQLAGQTVPLDPTTGADLPLQVIVSDDASPQPFPAQEATAFGAVVVRRTSNGGFGSAVNSGAAQAHHDLLLILNSDLSIGPSYVSDLVTAARPWLPAVVGPALLDGEGASDFGGRHFPTIGHQAVEWLIPLARWRERSALHAAVGHDTRAVPGVTTTVDWLVGACLLLPTESFRAVGGFDEGYFMNSEGSTCSGCCAGTAYRLCMPAPSPSRTPAPAPPTPPNAAPGWCSRGCAMRRSGAAGLPGGDCRARSRLPPWSIWSGTLVVDWRVGRSPRWPPPAPSGSCSPEGHPDDAAPARDCRPGGGLGGSTAGRSAAVGALARRAAPVGAHLSPGLRQLRRG